MRRLSSVRCPSEKAAYQRPGQIEILRYSLSLSPFVDIGIKGDIDILVVIDSLLLSTRPVTTTTVTAADNVRHGRAVDMGKVTACVAREVAANITHPALCSETSDAVSPAGAHPYSKLTRVCGAVTARLAMRTFLLPYASM